MFNFSKKYKNEKVTDFRNYTGQFLVKSEVASIQILGDLNEFIYKNEALTSTFLALLFNYLFIFNLFIYF